LHWIYDHRPVLRGIAGALRAGGRTLLQMGGQGNAAGVLAAVGRVIDQPAWRDFFIGFHFRYGFHAPQEYRVWLGEAGLEAQRIELIPKDMVHQGADGFAGWFRTTWMPWTQSVPELKRETFIADVVKHYVAQHAPDANGLVHVSMVRLEVDAAKRR
jgi:trans-aconitate methyltransferase